MLDSDKKAFSEMLNSIHEFYEKELSIISMDVWWASLSDLTIDEIKLGFNAHTRNTDVGQFMPKPADIRRNCNGRSVDNATGAWSFVEKALRHSGGYYDVVFDDPLIHITIEKMGGWVKLCSTESEKNLVFVAKEFKDVYRALYGTPAAYEAPPMLNGTMNIELRKQKGAKLLEPKAYGEDMNSIRKVYQELVMQDTGSIQGVALPDLSAENPLIGG